MRQKLTAITLSSNGKKLTVFAMCWYDYKDQCVVPYEWIHNISAQLGCRRGDTYVVG